MIVVSDFDPDPDFDPDFLLELLNWFDAYMHRDGVEHEGLMADVIQSGAAEPVGQGFRR